MKGVHPLSLLTRDDWNHVFARLMQPVDRWTTANSHPLFRSIFETDRKQEWITTLLTLTLPHVCVYMNSTTLLKLRLVNKSVQAFVDKLLEESHKFGGKPPCQFPVPMFHLREYLDPDRSDFNLESLLEQKCVMPKAKIVGGYVVCNELYPRTPLLRYITFFQEFGRDIHMLSLQFNAAHNSLHLAKLIRWVLRQTPNLKKLRLITDFSINWWATTHPFYAEQLQLFWRDNALPALPQLETLYLSFHTFEYLVNSIASDFGKPTIEAFSQAYGSQLRALSMIYHPTLLPTSMPLLQHLTVKLYTPEDLASVQALQAPLQQISVIVNEGCQFAPGQLFQSLETFQGTLTQLSLESQCWTFGKNVDWFLGKVELPLLKKLKLTGCFYGSGLPFLKHFNKQLQILEVDLWHPPEYQENEPFVGPLEIMWNKRKRKMRKTDYGRWIRANYPWDYGDYGEYGLWIYGAEEPARNFQYRLILNVLCCSCIISRKYE